MQLAPDIAVVELCTDEWIQAGRTHNLYFFFPAFARVLRVGGTVVLLLSQDLHKRMDSITKSGENQSPNASSDGAGEMTAVETSSSDGNSSSVVKGVEEAFLSSRQPRFGSLVLDGIYEVSLGKTVAFIYKYKKVSAAGN